MDLAKVRAQLAQGFPAAAKLLASSSRSLSAQRSARQVKTLERLWREGGGSGCPCASSNEGNCLPNLKCEYCQGNSGQNPLYIKGQNAPSGQKPGLSGKKGDFDNKQLCSILASLQESFASKLDALNQRTAAAMAADDGPAFESILKGIDSIEALERRWRSLKNPDCLHPDAIYTGRGQFLRCPACVQSAGCVHPKGICDYHGIMVCDYCAQNPSFIELEDRELETQEPALKR